MSSTAGTRINKFLSESGHCSRRAADQLVLEGRVLINGKVAVMGSRVAPGDKVTVDGVEESPREQDRVYLAFHKPVGIVCTTDTRREKDNIIDFIRYPERIFPIGRLDKASEGLIFLTNDGDIVNQILRARNHHEKEYLVKVDQPLTKSFIKQPCRVEALDGSTFRIILTQGLNRQIRRMCEVLGYRVRRLRRVRIMNVHLDLEAGHWRHLRPAELLELRRRVGSSSKTAEPLGEWDED